jgi:molybdopterin/thiamine biosynthesis adenylyltransferase
MSTFRPDPERADELVPAVATKSALVIGVGGLGCPAALALVRAGVGHVALADDDTVDVTNLHRQVLYGDDDVGSDKLDAALRALALVARPFQELEAKRTRLLPENARSLVEGYDVVLEGADNFGTKFLAADACRLAGRPLVHGAAVRFRATVWSVGPAGRPCYRCLFEDVPPADAGETCAEAGVMGPVVGFAGALMADLALSVLAGAPRYGSLFSYDGRRDRLREVPVAARPDCALCGPRATISRIDGVCYTAPCPSDLETLVGVQP